MKHTWLMAGLLGAGLLSGGCALWQAPQTEEDNTMPAQYAAKPVKIDGKLDDAVWQTAPKRAMRWNPEWVAGRPELARKSIGDKQWENGTVQMAWDDDYLYFAFDFTDSDVQAQNPENQTHLYLTGDLAEVFLKPANETYYWELYVAPTGNKTSLFFPGRGHLGLPDMDKELMPGLKTAAQIDGTLNNWSDRDNGWTGEMAVPIKQLEKYGAKFNADTPWTVFFGRYNYSRYLPYCENSSFPTASHLDFHLLEYYAPVKLMK